jgi:hypothetical protein
MVACDTIDLADGEAGERQVQRRSICLDLLQLDPERIVVIVGDGRQLVGGYWIAPRSSISLR